ncbi:MAG TPA: WG repeat-containing protein [Saprospiraceae bacterium]|nr:WG repeat-containing protein [Saprospiraceae bacterium]
MLKPGLTFLLFFLFYGSAFTQTGGSFRWVLPLQKNAVLIGQPAPAYLPMQEGKQIFLLAPDGSKKTLPYDSISREQGPFWSIWKTSLQGIYHVGKGEIIPPLYEYIRSVSPTETSWAFQVEKYGMQAIVDDRNRILLPYQKSAYARLSIVGDTILAYLKHDVYNFVNADLLYISRNGNQVADQVAKSITPADFQRISSNQYVFSVSEKGKTRPDTFAAAEKFVNNLALVKRDSLWGYLRRDGSWLLTPRFQAAAMFDTAGYAVVKTRGKYGVVKTDGAFLVEPRFAFLKASLPGFFEFKENGKIGLVNTAGKTVVPVGDFGGFLSAGTRCLAAKSGDTLLLFRHDGTLIPLSGVIECTKGRFDEYFGVRIKNKSGYRIGAWGILGADGQWRVPAVLSGSLVEYSRFFVAEAIVQPCCIVAGLNISENQPHKQLIFTRNGIPLLNTPVEVNFDGTASQFLIYRNTGKFGAVASQEIRLQPEFDEIKEAGLGWIKVRKGEEWGVIKWTE